MCLLNRERKETENSSGVEGTDPKSAGFVLVEGSYPPFNRPSPVLLGLSCCVLIQHQLIQLRVSNSQRSRQLSPVVTSTLACVVYKNALLLGRLEPPLISILSDHPSPLRQVVSSLPLCTALRLMCSLFRQGKHCPTSRALSPAAVALCS